MDQIKYLIQASLLALICFAGLALFHFISQNNFYTSATEPVRMDPSQPLPKNPKLDAGHILFREKCGSCHALDKMLSAPGLRGINKRGPWTDKENFKKWVSNPAAFIPTTEYTRNLQKEFGTIMPSFAGQLTSENLEAIYIYISEAPTVVALP